MPPPVFALRSGAPHVASRWESVDPTQVFILSCVVSQAPRPSSSTPIRALNTVADFIVSPWSTWPSRPVCLGDGGPGLIVTGLVDGRARNAYHLTIGLSEGAATNDVLNRDSRPSAHGGGQGQGAVP